MLRFLSIALLAAFTAGYQVPASRSSPVHCQLGRREFLVAGGASLLLGAGRAEAEDAPAAAEEPAYPKRTPGTIRKADQDAIGVSRVPDLAKAIENRGPALAGKGGAAPAGGLALGDAGREGVKLSYGYKGKTSVVGRDGAIGTSGPNGFFAGGEDFKGVAVGKQPSFRQ